jgi:hypothetical protein
MGGVIVQRQPHLSNQRVEATIDIDQGPRPERRVQLLPTNQLAGSRGQECQGPDCLRGQFDPLAAPTQLLRLTIDLEIVELEARRTRRGGSVSTG